jgi:hypothetical protein
MLPRLLRQRRQKLRQEWSGKGRNKDMEPLLYVPEGEFSRARIDDDVLRAMLRLLTSEEHRAGAIELFLPLAEDNSYGAELYAHLIGRPIPPKERKLSAKVWKYFRSVIKNRFCEEAATNWHLSSPRLNRFTPAVYWLGQMLDLPGESEWSEASLPSIRERISLTGLKGLGWAYVLHTTKEGFRILRERTLPLGYASLRSDPEGFQDFEHGFVLALAKSWIHFPLGTRRESTVTFVTMWSSLNPKALEQLVPAAGLDFRDLPADFLQQLATHNLKAAFTLGFEGRRPDNPKLLTPDCASAWEQGYRDGFSHFSITSLQHAAILFEQGDERVRDFLLLVVPGIWSIPDSVPETAQRYYGKVVVETRPRSDLIESGKELTTEARFQQGLRHLEKYGASRN